MNGKKENHRLVKSKNKCKIIQPELILNLYYNKNLTFRNLISKGEKIEQQSQKWHLSNICPSWVNIESKNS